MKSREKFGLIKIVQKLEIFRQLSEEEGLHVLGLCQRKAFQTSEVVWKRGDPGVDLQVLITGKLHVKNAAGKLIGQVLPGASFGEMACLTGRRRFVSFEAIEPSTALSLSRNALRGLIKTLPELYVKILETTIELLAERVSRTTATVEVADGKPLVMVVFWSSQLVGSPGTRSQSLSASTLIYSAAARCSL